MISTSNCLKLIAILLFSFFSSLASFGSSEVVERDLKEMFSNSSIKKKLGRNLKLSERIGLALLRKQISKAMNANCAQIILKNGDLIEADIIQIGGTEIRYKRCNRPNDPEFVISTDEVLSIRSSEGEILYRSSTEKSRTPQQTQSTDNARVDGYAIASIILGLLGLIFWWVFFIGIPLAILGTIFGGVSLSRIRRNPEKYRGRGLAWTGLIGGILTLSFWLLVLVFAIIEYYYYY